MTFGAGWQIPVLHPNCFAVWLPDMDWLAVGQSLRDRAARDPSPLRSVEPGFSSLSFIQTALQFGCPTWIRTMTR